MPGLGGANEIIVADIDLFPEFLEDFDHGIGKDIGLDILGGGGFDDFDPVLVGAGEEECLLAAAAMEAGQGVGGDGGVGVAEMGLAVGIVNRRRDVKGLAHGGTISNEGQQKNHRLIRL